MKFVNLKLEHNRVSSSYKNEIQNLWNGLFRIKNVMFTDMNQNKLNVNKQN